MSLLLLVAVAGITLGTRVTALAVLPPMRGPLAVVVERLPAPLFAALAALSLMGSQEGGADPAMLVAGACALASTRWRSLLVTLVAGLGGFAMAQLLW